MTTGQYYDIALTSGKYHDIALTTIQYYIYALWRYFDLRHKWATITYIILIPDISFLSKNTMKKNPAINTSPVMVPTTIPATIPGDRAVQLEKTML